MTATNPPPSILISNAHVFDGKGDSLSGLMSVLVEANKITKLAKSISRVEIHRPRGRRRLLVWAA